MASTYIVSTNLNDAVCAQERLQVYQNPTTTSAIDPTLVGFPNQETLVEAAAAFAIWNGIGSASKIKILDISVNETQGRTAATAQIWDMVRVSAISGGLDEPVASLDQAAPAFPTSILVRRRVNITQTGGSFPRLLDYPRMNPTRALELASRRYGDLFNGGLIFTNRNAAVQPIVLREGEGMAFLVANNVGRENYPVEICIWMTVGGNSYFTRRVGHPEAFGAAMAVFNPSGSGEVVNIGRVTCTEVMTDQQSTGGLPIRLTLETISGVNLNLGADALTPTPMDSANGALSSEIVIGAPITCLQMNKDSLLARSVTQRDDAYPLRRLAKAAFGSGPALAGLQFHGLSVPASCNSALDGKFDSAVTLRPGQGLGLFQRDVSGGWGHGFWVRVVFTVEPIVEQYAGSALNGNVIRGIGGNAVL